MSSHHQPRAREPQKCCGHQSSSHRRPLSSSPCSTRPLWLPSGVHSGMHPSSLLSHELATEASSFLQDSLSPSASHVCAFFMSQPLQAWVLQHLSIQLWSFMSYSLNLSGNLIFLMVGDRSASVCSVPNSGRVRSSVALYRYLSPLYSSKYQGQPPKGSSVPN